MLMVSVLICIPVRGTDDRISAMTFLLFCFWVIVGFILVLCLGLGILSRISRSSSSTEQSVMLPLLYD